LDKKPKTLSFGPKPNQVLLQKSDTVVVVEDIVSAIKCNRYVNALPLFGSSLTTKILSNLTKFVKIFIWLDADKMKNSMEAVNLLQQIHPCVSCIFTTSDPKECSDEEICKYLEVNA
ncbi:MAG: hypothetical protein ACRCST_04310, partial [Turicibacter sp.]